MEWWEESEVSPALSKPCGPRAEFWGPFSSYSFTAWQGWWCTTSVCKESVHLMGVWYSWGGLRQKKNERATEEWSQQLAGFPSHISRNTKNKTLFFLYFYILRWSVHKNNSFGATDSVFAVNQVNVDDWVEEKTPVNDTTHTHTHTHPCVCITNTQSK